MPLLPAPGGGGAERAHCRLKLALGIDLVVMGGNNVLSRFESFQYDEIVASPISGLDFPRLEITAAPIHKGDLAGSRLKYTGGRDGQLPNPLGYRDSR